MILPVVTMGQDVAAQRAVIDAEVEHISGQTGLSADSFSIVALKKVFHTISYRYSRNAKREVVMIVRNFSHKNDSIRQFFWLKGGELICAEESIISYFSENGVSDSSFWNGRFYFSRRKLIDQITLGHGKSELDTWNPEQEMLAAFSEAKRDIARNKKTHDH